MKLMPAPIMREMEHEKHLKFCNLPICVEFWHLHQTIVNIILGLIIRPLCYKLWGYFGSKYISYGVLRFRTYTNSCELIVHTKLVGRPAVFRSFALFGLHLLYINAIIASRPLYTNPFIQLCDCNIYSDFAIIKNEKCPFPFIISRQVSLTLVNIALTLWSRPNFSSF